LADSLTNLITRQNPGLWLDKGCPFEGCAPYDLVITGILLDKYGDMEVQGMLKRQTLVRLLMFFYWFNQANNHGVVDVFIRLKLCSYVFFFTMLKSDDIAGFWKKID